ncbi:D-amino-acid transaminase [Sneathiella sp. CAU 1612]|uniref:Probable branched-chain-amino-acid aminotransferase n=1 Tax=Sneathiella sedimenti TaxID=2816034 RepID=A0ABS3F8W1_9PROT|nr:D-amino-acid transaminase [Sneathiella sedimenti]MBO0334956.1 D-amino-acid transaminase [Sneathiella sedimenti]
MSRIAYVNGQYLPHRDASVHIEDRGYQFADGVYEVVTIVGSRMIDEEGHLDRLWRSLGELRIDAPMKREPLKMVMREVIRQNGIRDGIIYLQVTRGVAPRDHPFPDDIPTSLVMTAKRLSMEKAAKKAQEGVSVITVPDIRWTRRDIKSVSLLPNVLAKQEAKENGAYEAFQVDEDGMVTEGSSTNAWIVSKEGKIVTRPTSNSILAGITRASLIRELEKNGIELELRSFSVEELLSAREVFITSSTSYVLPVVKVDDQVIGNGHPGLISLKLRKIYEKFMSADA